MKKIIIATLLTYLLVMNINTLEAKEMHEDKIEIVKKENFQTSKGAADYFSGNVIVSTMLAEKNVSLAEVAFEKEAKTAWTLMDKFLS